MPLIVEDKEEGDVPRICHHQPLPWHDDPINQPPQRDGKGIIRIEPDESDIGRWRPDRCPSDRVGEGAFDAGGSFDDLCNIASLTKTNNNPYGSPKVNHNRKLQLVVSVNVSSTC